MTEPSSYTSLLHELGQGDVVYDTRKQLAVAGFQHTASYDTAIATYLAGDDAVFQVSAQKFQELRYGENSHQTAFAYREQGVPDSLADMEVLHGKALSFNNMVDIAGAVYAVSTL